MKRHRLWSLASRNDSWWRESSVSVVLYPLHNQSDRRSSRAQSIKKITPVGQPTGVLFCPPLSTPYTASTRYNSIHRVYTIIRVDGRVSGPLVPCSSSGANARADKKAVCKTVPDQVRHRLAPSHPPPVPREIIARDRKFQRHSQ